MARGRERWISFGPLQGQNSTVNPLSLGPGWASDTENIVLAPESSVGAKRRGSTVLAGAPDKTYMLARFKPPRASESQAELFAFTIGDDSRSRLFRKPGAGAWVEVPMHPDLEFIYRWVVFNGKMFFGATTTVNRLFCYDPALGTIRRVGLSPDFTPPVVSNTGSGSYAATLRYYKVDFILRSQYGVVLARSELSDATAFTPSGTGSGVSIIHGVNTTQANYYRVWGSTDNITYYKLSGDVPKGTPFVDVTAPTSYAGEQPQEVGTFLPPPAALRVITDGNRLLMARSGIPEGYVLQSSDSPHVPKANRVWYSPVIGTADQGDDERVPVTSAQKNLLDLGENTNDGAITEMEGPMDGQIYVFMQRRIWRLVPTGDLVSPYLSYSVSDRYGAQFGFNDLFVRSVAGEDEQGNPAIYFSSEYGLYRVGARNIQFVSYDVMTQIRGIRNAQALDVLWLMSYPQRKQLWLWVNHHIFVYHWDQGRPDEDGDIHGGWTHWVHADTTNVNYGFSPGVLYNTVPGSSNVADTRLIPYIAPNSVGNVYVFERSEGKDGDNTYDAWVKFAPLVPTESEQQFRVGNAQLIATAGNTSLRVSAIRDFGSNAEEVRHDDVLLVSPSGAPRVVRTLESLFSGDVTVLEVKLGEPTPQSVLWQVDLLRLPVYTQESR